MDKDDAEIDLFPMELRERNEDHLLLSRDELAPDWSESYCADNLLISNCADNLLLSLRERRLTTLASNPLSCALRLITLPWGSGSSITTLHMSTVRGMISLRISRSSASVREISVDTSSWREVSWAVSSLNSSDILLLRFFLRCVTPTNLAQRCSCDFSGPALTEFFSAALHY